MFLVVEEVQEHPFSYSLLFTLEQGHVTTEVRRFQEDCKQSRKQLEFLPAEICIQSFLSRYPR